MRKLLFFFMVCFAVSLVLARRDKVLSHFKNKEISNWNHKPFKMDKKSSKFCSNNTTAQAYLTRILSVIDDLQGNSSYSSILKLQSANFITYLQNTNNQNLLRSDCEDFIKGLLTAKKIDKEIQRTQKQLTRIIQKQLKQVVRDVNNGKGFSEFDI